MNNKYIKLYSIASMGLFCLSLVGCNTLGDKATSIDIIYGITTIVSFFLLICGVNILHKRDLWFFLLFGSVLVVNIGYFCLATSSNLEEALLANRISYLGSVCLPFSMLMIILHATKIKYPKCLPMCLSVVSALVFFVTATPGYLPIYYKKVSFSIIDGVGILEKVYGPWHKLYAVFLLGYFASMVAIIIYTAVKKKMNSVNQAIIIAIAVMANLCVWMLEQFVDIGFEFLSVSYIISEMFLLGLYLMIADEEKRKQQQIDGVSQQIGIGSSIDNEQLNFFSTGLTSLTKTEHAIYNYYISGKTTKEVLELLNIKENTLKFHNKNLYSKLGVTSRKQLREIHRQLHEKD